MLRSLVGSEMCIRDRRSFSYRSRYCCVSDRCWWPLWSCNHLRSPFRRWLDGGHRKVHHRHVNWRDVVVSGLVGGFTNGFGSWVSKTALLTKMQDRQLQVSERWLVSMRSRVRWDRQSPTLCPLDQRVCVGTLGLSSPEELQEALTVWQDQRQDQ